MRIHVIDNRNDILILEEEAHIESKERPMLYTAGFFIDKLERRPDLINTCQFTLMMPLIYRPDEKKDRGRNHQRIGEESITQNIRSDT